MIISALIRITPLVVSFGSSTLILEGILLLTGEQFEILVIKLAGVVTFDLLSIFQGDGSRFELLVVSAIGIMLAILLLFGCGLLNLTGVFVGVM